jgi:two-component system response regulator HydG
MVKEPLREPSHLNQARLVASSDSPVLLTGETGVGKDYLASFIHHHSPRRLKPFRNINCAAISPNLFESELFGCVRGAFTGAEKDRKGYVESANGGTLFLNEISTIPLDIQAKFLTTI